MKFSLNKPVIYVARDLERTLGLPVTTKGYYIISNYTAFANSLAKGHKNVLLIKNTELLDTRELLVHAKTINFIKKIKNPQVLVFKNTLAIEKICQENGWSLLNPSAGLASEVEEKITQVQWLGNLKKYLPPFEVKIANDVKWTGKKFILQFNRAHTGSGTILVENKEQLVEVQTKFPNREVRITKFISGPMLTNNNVVWGNKVLCGNISYQITGLKPFTGLPFATVGNDWALPHKILSSTQKKEYAKMAQEIGIKMSESGWKGLFGIDVICDEKTGKLYLIEINARQPASTSFESILQSIKSASGTTIFQAHLLALFGEKNTNDNLVTINDGAQIVQKILSEKKPINKKVLLLNIEEFCKNGLNIVYYENYKLESDWLRIQSKKGVMEKPGITNSLGQDIVFFVLANLSGKRLSKRYASDRVAAIITKNTKILLMKRTRFNKEYFVLPGGTVESGESLLQALNREIDEETGLKIIVSKRKPIIIKISGRKEYHFYINSFKGEAVLGGEEKEKNSMENNYQLIWEDISNLKNIDFYPASLKDKIFKK